MTTLREAAQQALEALVDIEWSNNSQWQSDRAKGAITALRAALAEPVQEPVAWQWLDTAHLRKRLPKNAEPGAWNPLFTAPPQRKPLAVEKIYALKTAAGLLAFARAIEKAHGIE